MNINIVTVNSGWILQKIAERLYNSNKEIFSISYYEPKNNVDANLYIDIHNCFHLILLLLPFFHLIFLF